jgi:hypothetical protein
MNHSTSERTEAATSFRWMGLLSPELGEKHDRERSRHDATADSIGRTPLPTEDGSIGAQRG